MASVYLAAKRLGNPFAGLLTVSLVLIVSPVLNLPVLFTVAYSDFGALSMAMASVLLWLLWLELRAEGLFVAMALCAGLAGSFKFTSLAIGIAWAPALLYASTWVASAVSSASSCALNVNGRYIRVHSTARNTTFGVSLFEFQVYGDPSPTCGP